MAAPTIRPGGPLDRKTSSQETNKKERIQNNPEEMLTQKVFSNDHLSLKTARGITAANNGSSSSNGSSK